MNIYLKDDEEVNPAIALGTSPPSGYTISPNPTLDWDAHAEVLIIEQETTAKVIRDELQILHDSIIWASGSPAQKTIWSKWFVASKANRDTIHSEAEQKEFYKTLIILLNNNEQKDFAQAKANKFSILEPSVIKEEIKPKLIQDEIDPISYFPFEGGNANDWAGSNHGTVVGATATVNGRVGEAYSFDGDDHIIINDVLTNDLALTKKGAWTFCVAPLDATPLDIEILISFNDTSANEFIHLRIKTTGELMAKCMKAGTTQWVIQTDNPVFIDNLSSFIAIVQPADGNGPILYIEALKPPQTLTTNTFPDSWFNDLSNLDNGRIGNRSVNGGGETNGLNGMIDEVKFYNRAPSIKEIETEHLRIKNHLDKLQNLRIGGNGSPLAKIHADQSSTTGAIPALYLDQADLSEDMMEFNTIIGVGNPIEVVGDKTLTTTHFIRITLPGRLIRYIPCGTIS